MTQVSLSFLYGVLRSTLAVYIALVALHFVLEVFFAHRAYRRSKQGFPDPARLPSVDVVVPCYNEDAEQPRPPASTRCSTRTTRASCTSTWSTTARPTATELRHVYERSTARCPAGTCCCRRRNRGKRHAQDAALRATAAASIVVTIDSDTESHPDGVTADRAPPSTTHGSAPSPATSASPTGARTSSPA